MRLSMAAQRDQQAGDADEGADPEAEHPAQELRAHLLQLGAELEAEAGDLGAQLRAKLRELLPQLRP